MATNSTNPTNSEYCVVEKKYWYCLWNAMQHNRESFQSTIHQLWRYYHPPLSVNVSVFVLSISYWWWKRKRSQILISYLPSDVSRKLSESSSSMLLKFLFTISTHSMVIIFTSPWSSSSPPWSSSSSTSISSWVVRIDHRVMIHLEIFLTNPNNNDRHWERGGGNYGTL